MTPDLPLVLLSGALLGLSAQIAADVVPCAHAGSLWLVSLVAIAAMQALARVRGSFRWRRMRLGASLRHLAAGTLTGIGAALIPGGAVTRPVLRVSF